MQMTGKELLELIGNVVHGVFMGATWIVAIAMMIYGLATCAGRVP